MDIDVVLKALICTAIFWPGLALLTAEEMYMKVVGVVMVIVALSVTVMTILQRPILMRLLFWG